MSNAKNTTSQRTLEWVPIADIRVSEQAQRELRPGKAAKIAADFDPDRFTPPVVSRRADGRIFVIDGQHRLEAMRRIGWEDQSAECFVYSGLTEAQEADLFLWHNDRTTVNAFDKFAVGVTARRSEEVEITRIVHDAGLKIANGGTPGSIQAVSALRKVHRQGPDVLGRTLRILNDSYGDGGLQAEFIDGVGLLCGRLNGDLDDERAIAKLSSARGGLGALRSRANKYRAEMGATRGDCVAGAATDIINSGKGGKKLPNWWSAA